MTLYSIAALVEDAASRFGDRPAITDGTVTLSFAELHAAASRTALALRRDGLDRGDRVGICMAKTVDQAVAILGVALADAIIVPILPRLKREGIRHIVTDVGMRLVITDAARAGEIHAAVPELPFLYGHSGAAEPARDLTLLRTTADGRLPMASIGSDVAAVIYSSGSTGRPKGIMVSHRNIVDGARITAAYLGTSGSDRIGSLLSLNFDYGLNQLWQSLLTGAMLCLHELIFPADCFTFLAEQRITALPVMPAIITRMFDPRLLRSRPAVDLTGVRYISSSGGPVSQRMLDNLAASFPAARTFLMYGLTEAFRSTYLDPAELHRRPTSIGRAIPEVEILVLDEQLRQVAPGEHGQLVHRGGCISKGYWNAPAETAQRFGTLPQYPGETVVFSGDIVYSDAEGYLYFVGRRDAMIKTSGFRVSPTEVEEIAVQFPGIDSCAAVGVANVEVGQDIALLYTAARPVDEPAYRRFLAERLPRHMVPRHLFAEESLPVTGNQGKLDRPALAERAISRLARQPAGHAD
ncbi:MAG TPA: AMP-binding protein [Jatrophihabitans sp.]|nr:AMP-binding protein [Jatrophihabitans sp.]